MKIQDLTPALLWSHFAQLNAVPRASKKEARVIQFMKDFGESQRLETTVDATGNVLIKKPATAGREGSPTVILQGHLDMVHQKNADSDFDFDKEGIKMYIDGDWVKARGTTLGADNGIGVAAIMSVLAATDIQHPAIEAIFTIDEEVGLTGAMGLQKDFLKGKILLNLDSEEDDALTIGSAGGVDVEIKGNYQTQVLSPKTTFFKLSITGLSGGHSGVDIHKGKSNAIKLLTRVVYQIEKKLSVSLCEMQGGNLTNAIPRECFAVIGVEAQSDQLLKKQILSIASQLKVETRFSDPDFSLEIEAVGGNYNVLPKRVQRALIAGLYSCPNGIYRMTPSLNELVQTSNNVAKVLVQNGTYEVICHSRSFIESERDDLVAAISSSFMATGAEVAEVGPYPGWEPDTTSQTLGIAKEVYSSLFGTVPKIYAIHAGLECGIFAEIYAGLDIVSFGPNIVNPHSPDEALQISSAQKFWSYLVAVLKEL